MEATSASLITHLWTGVWQGTLLIIFVWCVCKAFPRLPAKARYWFWWLASLKIVISFLPAFSLPVPANSGVVAKGVSVLQEAATTQLQSPVVSDGVIQSQSSNVWIILLGVLWLAGVVWGLAVLIREWVLLRSLLMRSETVTSEEIGGRVRKLAVNIGVQRLPRIVRSDEVTSPFVAGFGEHWLVLPKDFEKDLSSEEINMALAHELYHVKRNDVLLGIIPSLARLLFFFFPPIYLVCREWAIERESLCDADAMALTSGSASQYGGLLMKIVSGDHAPSLSPCLGATSAFHSLKIRIERIKSYEVQESRTFRAIAWPVMAITLLLLLPWQCSSADSGSGAGGATKGNVVVNGSFEQGLSGWRELMPSSNASVDTQIVDGGHSGKAIQFTKTESRFFPFSLYDQKLPKPPASAKKANVSVWIKADGVTKATVPLFLDTGPNNGDIKWAAYVAPTNENDPPLTHDWKQYTASIDLPANLMDVRVGMEMYGPGKVSIDDLEVTYQ